MPVFHSPDELATIARPVATAVGFFDGVHLGHQSLLAELAQLADSIDAEPLVITFANSPKQFHTGGSWQYLTLPAEKLLLLEQAGVEHVLMLQYDEGVAGQTAAGFFRTVFDQCRLAGLVAGYDSAIGCDMVSGEQGYRDLASELGVALRYAAPLEIDGRLVKSSLIRQFIEQHQLREATTLLGRPFTVMGTVEHGKGKGGREIAVPTANILLDDEKLAPPTGIYAARAELAGVTHPAAVCIMDFERSRHTALDQSMADDEPEGPASGRVLEAHLVGFDGDIYGEVLNLGILAHVRDWIDFATPEALRQQIAADISRTLELCNE